MFGGNTKRGFVRTEVGSIERFLSWSLLGLLIAIGGWVVWKGQHFDPHIFELDPELLATVPPPREQVKLFEEWADMAPRSSREAEAETSSRYSDIAPEGWKQTGSVEAFTSETLYEKINGRAEQYRAFNVVGLEFVGFDNGSQFIDVFVYDMGDPAQAYGIYSVERNEGMPPVELGREGYQVAASYFIVKGQYYVQVIGSDVGEAMEQAALEIATAVTGQLEESGDALWGNSVLPAEGRLDETTKYFVKDAMNFSFLTNTFSARYRFDNVEFTAFIARQSSSDASDAVLASYLGFLADYGEVVGREDTDEGVLVVGDTAGYYDVVFKRGTFVGGVVETTNRAAAEQFVAAWLESSNFSDKP